MKGFRKKKTLKTECVNTELFKCSSQKMLTHFTDLNNMYWRNGHILKEWNIVLIGPICKGDRHISNINILR